MIYFSQMGFPHTFESTTSGGNQLHSASSTAAKWKVKRKCRRCSLVTIRRVLHSSCIAILSIETDVTAEGCVCAPCTRGHRHSGGKSGGKSAHCLESPRSCQVLAGLLVTLWMTFPPQTQCLIYTRRTMCTFDTEIKTKLSVHNKKKRLIYTVCNKRLNSAQKCTGFNCNGVSVSTQETVWAAH